MPLCHTPLQELSEQLRALHLRECQLNASLAQKIAVPLGHYQSPVREVHSSEPGDVDLVHLQHQLALHKIEKFRHELLERIACLRYALAVQEAMYLLNQCDTLEAIAIAVGDKQVYDSTRSVEESVLQITSALQRLQECNNEVPRQLGKLAREVEELVAQRLAADHAAPAPQTAQPECSVRPHGSCSAA